jgi:hypothetical protein
MIKVLAFVSRLPHVTREAFRSYYETTHAPMIPGLMPTISSYERNYPNVSRIRPPEGKTLDDMVEFDAVTILRFEDQAAFDAYKQVLRDPAVMALIQADEANFLDSRKTRLFIVDEQVSQLAPRQP